LKERKSFYHRLYVLVHDTVDSDKLLMLMDVKLVDDLREDNPEAAKIIDQGAVIIGKFVFVAQHLGQYFEDMVKDSGKDPLDPHVDFWHIQDQLSEVWIEALHSLLAVRAGLVKQGIYMLRRCHELSVYGTFYSSTFIKLDSGEEINPFVELSGHGLWVRNLGKSIGRRDVQGVEDQIKAEKGVSAAAARRDLLSNFTRYYLSRLCTAVCDEHKKRAGVDNAILLETDRSFVLTCLECGGATNSVIVERPLTFEIMRSITNVKLDLTDDYGSETSRLYAKLSAILHPNNPGHQHAPKFDKKTLQDWSTTLSRILRLSLVFYSRGLSRIGYEDKETFSLLEQRKYDLDKISLKELYFAICEKVGFEFNKRNPGYKYEDDDHNIPSYLDDKGQTGAGQ